MSGRAGLVNPIVWQQCLLRICDLKQMSTPQSFPNPHPEPLHLATQVHRFVLPPCCITAQKPWTDASAMLLNFPASKTVDQIDMLLKFFINTATVEALRVPPTINTLKRKCLIGLSVSEC